MNILHLISYGNDNFKNSKVRLFNECIESKFFHNINIYNYNDLDTNFVHDFEKIFRYPRGNGYWIWKPYLIKKKIGGNKRWRNCNIFRCWLYFK